MNFDKLTKEDAELLSYKDLTSLILEEKGKKNTYYTNTKSACKKFLLTMSTKEDFELAKIWIKEGEKRWKS